MEIHEDLDDEKSRLFWNTAKYPHEKMYSLGAA